MKRFAVSMLLIAGLFLFGCVHSQVKTESEAAGAPAGKATNSNTETIMLSIPGVTKESAPSVESALKKVSGVSSVQVDPLEEKAMVQVEKGKVSETQLMDAVNKVIKTSQKPKEEKTGEENKTQGQRGGRKKPPNVRR